MIGLCHANRHYYFAARNDVLLPDALAVRPYGVGWIPLINISFT